MAARRSRYAVPVVVAGAIALGSWVPTLSASAAPKLPAITAQQLIEKVEAVDVTHLSGTVEWSADLGLPSLSSLTSGGGQGSPSSSSFDPTSLLSGNHSFAIAVDGPDRLRVSSAASLAESDLVVNGHQAWTWDSSTGRVTHYVVEGRKGSAMTAPPAPPGPADHPAGRRRGDPGRCRGLVDHRVDRDTRRRRRPGRLRAHPDARPQRGRCLGEHRGRYPYRCRRRHRPAPAGQHRRRRPGRPGAPARLHRHQLRHPVGLGLRPPPGADVEHEGYRPPSRSGGPRRTRTAPAAGSGPTTVGSRWDTVAVIPAGETAGLAGVHLSVSGHLHRGAAARPAGAVAPPLVDNPEVQDLTTAVSGPWGQGRLLSSSLVNVLILSDGRVLVGAVTPSALEADAAGLAS